VPGPAAGAAHRAAAPQVAPPRSCPPDRSADGNDQRAAGRGRRAGCDGTLAT
jgi:hypothetical protein